MDCSFFPFLKNQFWVVKIGIICFHLWSINATPILYISTTSLCQIKTKQNSAYTNWAKTVGIFCVIWEGLEFYKDSYSNACHRNIGFLICQFGNILARPLSPSTLNMTMAERSKDKKLFLYHSEPEKTKRQNDKKETERHRDRMA